MSIRHVLPTLGILMMGLVAPLRAELPWQQVRIEGASISDVYAFPDVTFARTNQQIFRLRAGLTDWQRLPAGAGNLVLAEPSLLLVQRGLDLYRSRDDGDSWTLLPFPVTVGRFQSHNVARDADSGALFVAHWRQENGTVPMLWRSSDDGATWQEVGALRASPNFFRIAVAGSRIFLFRLTEIDRSDDGGATFLTLSEGDLPPTQDSPGDIRVLTRDTVDPFDPQTLYRIGVSAESSGVQGLYKTSSAGDAWRSIASFPAAIVDLELDPRVPGRIVVASAERLLESLDGGETWAPLPTPPAQRAISGVGLGLDTGTHWLSVQPEEGLLVTRDRGETWAPMNRGLHAVAAFRVAFSASQEIAGASQGMFTINNGIASRKTSGGVLPFRLTAAASDRRSLSAVTLDQDGPEGIGRLLSSADGGETWSEGAYTAATAFADYDASVVVRQTIVEMNVERSLDGGSTWSTLLSRAELEELVVAPYVWTIAMPEPGRIHILGSFAGMLSSFDDGQTWQLYGDANVTGSAFWRIAVDPFDSEHMLAFDSDFIVTNLGRVVESRDSGRTWDRVSFDIGTEAKLRSVTFDPSVQDRLYVSRNDGVFRSDDGGLTWEPRNLGLQGLQILDLAIDPERPTRLLAGTDAGPYIYQQSDRCVPGPRPSLCLDGDRGDERFQISLRWQTAQGGGREGDAEPLPLAPLGIERGGLLHFGNPANPEVLVKVLDGCSNNDHFWVFASAATTLGYELVVRDLAADVERIYRNTDGELAPTITDTRAFATCDVPRRSVPAPSASTSLAASAVASGGGGTGQPILPSKTGTCVADPTTLCIDGMPGDRRFRVRMAFESAAGGGVSGDAQAFSIEGLGVARGGLLHFGNGSNPEVLFKVLNGCENNDHFWVFFSAATTLGFDLTVEDTVTGETRAYSNPDGMSAASVADTRAFATCDAL